MTETPYVEFTLPRSTQDLMMERLIKALEYLRPKRGICPLCNHPVYDQLSLDTEYNNDESVWCESDRIFEHNLISKVVWVRTGDIVHTRCISRWHPYPFPDDIALIKPPRPQDAQERIELLLLQLVKSVESIAQELRSVQVIPPITQPQTPKRSKFFWRLRHRRG